MMKKLLQLATFALLFTGVASAQTTGSITGVVTDGASGKPVVGAVVVATSPAAPGEQTAVTDDISRNIVAIREIGVQTAAGARETASASDELKRLSGRLQELVGRFRL